MTIGYDPPRGAGLSQWQFIKTKPMKMLKMAVHKADLLKGPKPKGGLKPISVNHHICMTCIVRQV